MIKISPTAKLPVELCKGAYEQRFDKAQKLTDEFFNKISKKFTTKLITDTFGIERVCCAVKTES